MKRSRIMLQILGLAILLLGLLTACTNVQPSPTVAPTTATEPTNASPEKPIPENMVLYWNVDRAQYEGKGEAGMTGRKPNADGYFPMLLAFNGEFRECLVKSQMLASRLDMLNMFGLVFNEQGVIVDLVDMEDFTGGLAANRFYVEAVEGNTVLLDSSDILIGVELRLTLSPETKIYDVSGEPGVVPGSETQLRISDRVIAVQDRQGNITHIWVMQREAVRVVQTRYCAHCDAFIEWTEWMETDKLPTSGTGHYFLTDNVQLKGQQSIAADQTIILDLNGKTVTGKENSRVYAVFNEGSNLVIMDTSEAKTGKLVATGTAFVDQGSVVWVRYGSLTLYSGTLDASQATSLHQGVCIAVEKNTRFEMIGGTVIGGSTTCNVNTKGSNRGGWGGAIYLMGTMNMSGGTIQGGKVMSMLNDSGVAQRGQGGSIYITGSGVLNMTDGEITGGKAENGGGNIYLAEGAKFTMNGGTVSNGTLTKAGSSVNGGNIYIKRGATFTLNGGTVTGGVSMNSGGNIYGNGVFNMYGGTVKDGKSKENSSNHNVHMVNAEFNMTGGHIVGYVELAVSGDKTMVTNISGTAKIIGAPAGKNNLRVNTKAPINVGTLQAGAQIGITGSGVFTTQTAASNAQYFVSDNAGGAISYADGCLKVS